MSKGAASRREYTITPGRIEGLGWRGRPLIADYVLIYRNAKPAVILAVGYRVRSHRGTQFRQWATERLAEYLVKGFTMDDERLKNPPGKGQTD